MLLCVPAAAQPPTLLTLQEAVALAMRNNPRLASALKDIEAAQAQVGVASATLYPTVNVGAQTSTNSGNAGGGNNNNTTNLLTAQALNPTGGGGGGAGLNQLSLNVQQILLDFGKRAQAIRATEKQAEATAYAAEALRQDLVLEVRQRYYQAHTDQETVRIQQGVVANQERHVREARGFFRAGLQARNEVARAEAELAQAQLDLVLAQTALQQDWVALNQSLGRSDTRAYQLQVESVEAIYLDPPLEKTVELSYAHRPEGRQIAAQIEAATARMEQAFRNRYPTLSANAQTGMRGINPNPLDDFWSVGLNLSFNLFNGFLDRYQAEGFRAQAESLAFLLESTRQQIFRDTATAVVNLHNARAAIDAAAVNVRASAENFRLAQRRYETGLGSNLEYHDAQLLLARAQIGEVQALNRYRTALAALLRATGIEDFTTFRHLMEAP